MCYELLITSILSMKSRDPNREEKISREVRERQGLWAHSGSTDTCILCNHRKKYQEAATQILPDPRRSGAPDVYQYVSQLGTQRGHC